jgi:hypothetical protein
MPKTVDDIIRIFNREKLPYFSIHNTKGKRLSRTPDDVMKIDDDKERLEASLEWLENEVLPDLDEGVYRIKLQPNMNAGKAAIEYDFMIGDPPQRTATARVGNTGGINGIAGFEFIAGLMNSSRSNEDYLRDKLRDKEMELLRAEFKIKDLEKEVEAKVGGTGSWDDIFKDVVKENAMDILERFVPEKEGKTQIATLKDRRTVPPIKVKKATENADTDADGDDRAEPQQEFSPEERQERTQRLKNIMKRTAEVFPRADVLEVWETILDLAENSAGAEMVVNMIKSKLKKRTA